MRDFDAELTETLKGAPHVLGLYRYDGEEVLARYTVLVDAEPAVANVQRLITERVDPNLEVTVRTWKQGDTVSYDKALWQKPVPARSTRPSRDELVEALKDTFVAQRNAVMVEEGVQGHLLAGYMFDVSDPVCPARFKEMMGGDRFIRTCKASNQLPLAVGVMPKRIIADHILDIARRVEKLPAPSVILMDAPMLPRTIVRLMAPCGDNEMVVVTGYDKALGLKAVAVPTIITKPK